MDGGSTLRGRVVKAAAPLTEQARAELLPRLKTVAAARTASRGCRACPLWKNATQTVFGEGADTAKLMFVGEQPGDQEDLAGKPFVGPAGKILHRALAEAGIDADEVFITNAVKHFKHEPRGKKRIHQKPNTTEVRACYPWLKRERELVKPNVLVLLGATAVLSVLGKAMPIGKNRGKPFPIDDGGSAFVTVHPSYLLRIPDRADKEKAYQDFVADLKNIRAHLV
jgi:DNA polymerase